MGDFLNEINGLMNEPVAGGPPVAGKPGQSFSDEINGLMQTPAPAPRSSPREYNLVGLYNWVRENPRQAADLLVQTGFSVAGGIAGAPAGPPGMILGAGLGNLAGDIAGSVVGGRAAPTLSEAALDVGLGALGPGVANAPKIGARLATGANATVRREAREAGLAAHNREWDKFLNMSTAGLEDAAATGAMSPLRAASDARQAALRATAGGSSNSVGTLLGYSTAGGGLYTLLAHGNVPMAAAVLAGGATASFARREAAERLLNNPRIVNWIIREQPGTPAQVFSGLSTAVAPTGGRLLTADEMADLNTLTGSPNNTLGGPARRTDRSNPFDIVATPSGDRFRDTVTGRFVEMGGSDE